MATDRISRSDQADLARIIDRGGPRILIGQLVAYRPAVGADAQLFEVDSYDRHLDSFVLQHPVTKVRLRARAIPSELHIGEASREKTDPILELLHGVGIDPAPYLIRRTDRAFRAPSPRSPNRAFGEPRRRAAASPPRRFPAAAPFAPGTRGPPPAMGTAPRMPAPLAGPRGPAPLAPGGAFAPPGFGPMPPWGTLYHPPGSFSPGPPAYPPLPLGLPLAAPPPHSSPLASAVVDPSLAELRTAVERLQSETREIRSGGSGSRSDLSSYAVAHLRKLHSSMSARDFPGLHSQITMGLSIALAPRAHKSILALGLCCSTDVKDIDMKFYWIGDGIFSETFGYCEAEGEDLTPEQIRAVERKVINFYRQERAKAIALVAKYPYLYGKKK